MNIFLLAQNKSFDEFLAAYSEGDHTQISDGRTLLSFALANTDPAARYAIANFLLDQGASADWRTSDGNSAFHIALGQRKHDLPQTIALCRRLLEAGADVNALNASSVDALQEMIQLKFVDADLSELYDLWFSQKLTNLEAKNFAGFSTLDLARKIPYRQDLAQRMETHLEHAN